VALWGVRHSPIPGRGSASHRAPRLLHATNYNPQHQIVGLTIDQASKHVDLGSVQSALLEASAHEVRAKQEALRRDLEQLDARAPLACEDPTRAGEIEAICAPFAQGAAEATPEERRAILDAPRCGSPWWAWSTAFAAWCPSWRRAGPWMGTPSTH
jgi:hypothetical protein